MEKTIIVGNIEFFNRSVLIHSVDEVYKSGSEEELEILIDTFDKEGKDWLVIETCLERIEVTNKCLLKLLVYIRGE